MTPRKRPAKHAGGRPTLGSARRLPIQIRIDPDVLATLRAQAAAAGVGYQSLINDVLAAHVKGGAAAICASCGGTVQRMADGRLIRHFDGRTPSHWCANV